MGTLGSWRKQVPGFSMVACPLYSSLRKGKPWKWGTEHDEAAKTLIEELKAHQSLGPVHPHDPIIAERGFAEHGTCCNLFQTGRNEPKRPTLLSPTAFKETEQRYSDWEDGLSSWLRAIKEVEKMLQEQLVQTRGPFNLLETTLKRSAPLGGSAQKSTVRKCCACRAGAADEMQLTEGHTKVSMLQMPVNTDPLALHEPFNPSPMLGVPSFTADPLPEGVWFTDTWAKRVAGKRPYKAVALEINTGKEVTEEGEGSAQVGELRAVALAVQNEAKVKYVDFYAVWAGATRWLCPWEALHWEINRSPVWRTDDWQLLLSIARETPFPIGWVKAHAKDNKPATNWNQKVDELTKIRKTEMDDSFDPAWYRLGKWLHQKLGPTGWEALYLAAQSRGRPLSRKICKTVLTGQAKGRLRKYLKPHSGQWDSRLSKTLPQINSRYGPYGSPITWAFLTSPLEKPLNNGCNWSNRMAMDLFSCRLQWICTQYSPCQISKFVCVALCNNFVFHKHQRIKKLKIKIGKFHLWKGWVQTPFQ